MSTLKFTLSCLSAVVCAVAAVWLFIHAFKNSDNRKWLTARWLISIGLIVGVSFPFRQALRGELHPAWLIPYVLMVGAGFIVMWGAPAADILANPFSHLFDGGSDSVVAQPLYSIARSKRAKGFYLEAIAAIDEQLEKFPNDMEGTMMRATIQAEDLHDMPGAEQTLTRFCDHARVPDGQIAAALNHLADWQLQIAHDAGAARAALEKIADRFPGSELALVAAQRIAHLSNAELMMRAKNTTRTFAVPEGVQNVGLLKSSAFLQPAQEDPVALAGLFVKHLQQHPQDTEVREKLAVIYADHYGRLDMATIELSEIIDQPNQPAKRVAHCLTVLANLQIRHGADYDTVRRTLERIVTSFPNLPVARSAQSRIDHLRLELKGAPEGDTGRRIKLHSQEDQLGGEPGE